MASVFHLHTRSGAQDLNVNVLAVCRSSGFGFALVECLLVQGDFNADAVSTASPSAFGFALVGLLLAQGRECVCCTGSKKCHIFKHLGTI